MVYDIILALIGTALIVAATWLYCTAYRVDQNGTIRDAFPYWKLVTFCYGVAAITMIGILL